MKKLFLPLFLLMVAGSVYGMRGGRQVEQKADFDFKQAVTIIRLKKDKLAVGVERDQLNVCKEIVNQEAGTLNTMSKANMFSNPTQTVDGAKQRAIIIEKAAALLRLRKECPAYVEARYMPGVQQLVTQIAGSLAKQ